MLTTLVLIATGGFASLLLPCVTPFGALAACAALRGRLRSALFVVGATWAVNEAAGFFFFGYPRTSDSYAWALLQVIAAAVATAVAAAVVAGTRKRPFFMRAVLTLAVATLVFESALALAARLAGLSLAAFSLPIDALVIETNVLFFLAFEAAALLLGAVRSSRGRQQP